MRVWPGRPYPLGAAFDGSGVNVAVFSEEATAVDLCLFDGPDGPEVARVRLPERTEHTFHGYLPDLQPGAVYGFRADGPFDPATGRRFNPAKLLLDPYARAIARDIRWNDALYGYPFGGGPDADLRSDRRDSGPFAPRALVIEHRHDWDSDRRPGTPWHRTVIYEAHVRGLTRRHPDVPPELRGTYAALGHPAVIAHLQSLGVTALELLPIQYHVDERAVHDRGLTNYWGYNTLGFLAPDPRFAATADPAGVLDEFRVSIGALHAAGLEVILDVVYNHTAEGNELGPTLSFRGLDNRAYYRLDASGRRHVDFTGTGNSLRVGHPRALQLIMDSLRYWVNDVHVDGFRFDLAAALARELWDVDKLSSFFDVIGQDPVLSRVKLIAEPWDVGPGGYQVGEFPVLWSEWNGRYRDAMRRFWRGDPGLADDFATRFAGSSDLYQDEGRTPLASVNFVTAHDGFTLLDLVSYDRKHNEPNLEGNRDGSDANDSWNHGVEGPTTDPATAGLRARQRRNFLVTLFLSQGVPMLRHGDEMGQTQLGNNNGYCQDNETSWLDWEAADADLLAFVRRVAALRAAEPVFRRRRFLRGRAVLPGGAKDVYWIRPDGRELGPADWVADDTRSLGVGLVGDQIDELDDEGRQIEGNTFLLLVNADWKPVAFALPRRPEITSWVRALDTTDPGLEEAPTEDPGSYWMGARSMAVLRAVRPDLEIPTAAAAGGFRRARRRAPRPATPGGASERSAGPGREYGARPGSRASASRGAGPERAGRAG